MYVRDFWTPTTAARARLAQLGIKTERRDAPQAHLHYGCELPDGEFAVVRRGTPACPTVIGVAE